jgi:hypothetical protein
LLIPILSLTFLLSAQSDGRFSVELDMARVARPHGLFEAGYYDYTFPLLNGARLIYHHTPRWNAFIGLRRLPFRLLEVGYSSETSRTLGMELRAGALFSPHKLGRFSLSYGLEVFGEWARTEGNFQWDYPPVYEILYRKSYIGLAPSLMARFVLTEHLSLIADTRLQVGQVFFRPLESSPVNQAQFVTTNYTMSTWNPLNSLALRVSL